MPFHTLILNKDSMKFKLIIVSFLVLVVSGCRNIETTKTLYLAHSLPQSHPVHKGILKFQEVLDSKSGGQMKIKVFPDGQLGSEREVLELLQIGSVAATKVSAATLSNFVPEYHILFV